MSDGTGKRIVLIDGSGYIFRAFFALPPMTRPDGTPVNAVYGFCAMLFKLMQDHADDDLVVVFDTDRRSFRTEIYDAYKANRDEPPPELVPQFQLIRDATRAFRIPAIERAGFEADDIIATYVKRAREAGEHAVVVSSDKDLMQLVGPGVTMWDPVKSVEIDREAVEKRFGVGPELMRDCLALAGDSSDNVPGVPGIGVKTAATLLGQFGDLETLLARAEEIRQPKRRQTIVDNAGQARLSQTLVSLEDAVPDIPGLDDLRREAYDPSELLAFLQENGFKTLIARIADVQDAEAAGRETDAGAPRYVAITSMDELDRWIARATGRGIVAVDTETTSLSIARASLVGISLAVEPGEGAYIPLGHVDDFGNPAAGQLPIDEALDKLRPLLADPSVLKVGHNIKYDLGVLARYDMAVTPVDDTMLLSYALDGASHGHSMDELARRHLDHATIPYASVAGTGKAQITFDKVPIDKATDYAAEDAEVTLRLHGVLKPRLAAEHMATLYETLERPLVGVIADMEGCGIRVDRHVLERLSADFTARMNDLQDEAYKLAGREFNIGSPKQLGEVLFDEMGLKGGRKGKTGAYSTDADVLEGLAAQGHALPTTVLAWRQLQKLTRTYTDALVEEIAPDGRIHTSYALAATSTGRLSSNEPNLQNIPIRTDEGRKIRTAFVPEKSFVLMSADYSQIELRVLSDMADIEALRKAFADGTDIHAVTASQMFGVDVTDVGPDLRRSAKMINYGIVYGIGAFGLAQRLGIEQKVARDYIASYFEQYPGIREYMDRTKETAREKGFVSTLFGRRCYVPDINNRVPNRRNYAERQAINAPIQGTAADIMKRAMIRLHKKLARNGAGARMLLQVHDELVLEVPKGEAKETADLVRQTMETAAHLSVPLEVDVGWGANWDEAH